MCACGHMSRGERAAAAAGRTSSVSCADTFPLAGEGFWARCGAQGGPSVDYASKRHFKPFRSAYWYRTVRWTVQDQTLDLQGCAPPCGTFPLTRGSFFSDGEIQIQLLLALVFGPIQGVEVLFQKTAHAGAALNADHRQSVLRSAAGSDARNSSPPDVLRDPEYG